jgi:hypothetical protein
MLDGQVRELQQLVVSHENSKALFKDTIIKYLVELEEQRKKDRRAQLNEQGTRLGRVSSIRQGSKLVEVWEEGD